MLYFSSEGGMDFRVSPLVVVGGVRLWHSQALTMLMK